MSENRRNRPPPQPVRKISRREMLSLTVGTLAVADSLLSHVPARMSGRRGFTKGFWEQIETGTFNENPKLLRELLEKQFNIEIISPSTGVNEFNFKDEKVQALEWDSPQLKGLALILNELPAHFYAPKIDQKGFDKPLKIGLHEESTTSQESSRKKMISRCMCGGTESVVVFSKNMLSQTLFEKKDFQTAVVHELTHYVTASNLDKYINTIAVPLGIEKKGDLKKVFASELSIGEKTYRKEENGELEISKRTQKRERFEELRKTFEEEPIFIEDVVAVDPDLLKLKGEAYVRGLLKEDPSANVDRLRKQGEIYYVNLTPIEELTWKSYVGYGATNFDEFFSVGAQFYVQGRQTFIETYKPFLGEEKAVIFYEGMKREIFLGRKY